MSISEFLEKHGTVLLLYSLVVGGFVTTVVVGVRTHLEPKEVFGFAAGFASGAFSAMALAMKVGNGSQPPPPSTPGPSTVS